MTTPLSTYVNIMNDSNNCETVGNKCSTDSSCSVSIGSTALGVQLTNFQSVWSSASKTDALQFIAAKDDPKMPLRVRNLLATIGNERILKIQLGRTPVQGLIVKVLNFLSDSKFSEKQLELDYDEIYHNYLLITIQNSTGPEVLRHILGNARHYAVASTVLKLEKTQRVALGYPMIPDDLIDLYDIPLTPNKLLTLNQLISMASNVDKNFYKYDAATNNMCQTFVENIIEINGLMPNIHDQTTLNALKPQDGKALIATLGSRSNLVKVAIDLGRELDKLVFDHKIRWKKSPPKDFASLPKVSGADSE
ncbi:unnamed protein product, partial [Rotaria sp. Silwood1]